MSTLRPQRTLAAPATVAGFGYWSSLDVRVEFRPAPIDTGVVFVRADLPGRPRIAARVENRIDMPRRTNLAQGAACVEMVEHVMAALAGLQIDNCEVWCDSGEMPGPDGSSRRFVEALLQAGAVEQDAARKQLVIRHQVRVEDGDAWAMAEPGDRLELDCQLDFGPGPIGRQQRRVVVTRESFLEELASARTFIMAAEADWLQQQGLGLRTTHADLLVFDEHGPRDNPLRFDDECVRHKTLDLLGDLALTDCDIVGRVSASRAGHKLHTRLLAAVLRAHQVQSKVA